MSRQYFTMCTYRKFPLFLFIVGHLSWFWVLQIVASASISIGIQMFFHYTASVSLNVHPEMVLMVCMAGIDALLEEMLCFSPAILTCMCKESSPFSILHQYLTVLLLLLGPILIGVKWNLTWVLTYIFLVTIDAGHFFIHL